MSTLEFSRSLARSAIVSVAVERMGGLLDHPMGNGQYQWECHKRFLSRQCWEYHHPQLGNVIDVKGDPIKPVTNVDFDEFYY